jgi:hypothetical protein
VAGGFALGYTVGALVHLVAGAPSGRVTAGRVAEALRRAGIDVTAVRPASVDARGSTPFFAETAGGTVFVKAVGADQRDADLLFKLWRSLAYQNLDDEKPFRSAKRQIQVEALLDLLAARAGVQTPDVVALSELEDGTTLLAHQGAAGPRPGHGRGRPARRRRAARPVGAGGPAAPRAAGAPRPAAGQRHAR